MKTTYYLRTMSATHAEKSTVHAGAMNAVSSSGGGGMSAMDAVAAQALASAAALPASDIAFCSIDNPDCEACQ